MPQVQFKECLLPQTTQFLDLTQIVKSDRSDRSQVRLS